MWLKTILISHGCRPAALLAALALAGCASGPSQPRSTDAAGWQQQLQARALPQVLLLGEQHDAAEHQRWQQATVAALAQRGQLAALVLEMAEAGASTSGLARSASEAEVQAALRWNEAGWPWRAYGPAVMAAVQAGVPVLGGNLPRGEMRAVMLQREWDQHLPAAGWLRQQEAIRAGHCDLLPGHQIAPMARIQLAKDARLAQTAAGALRSGQTVVLIAGRGHVLRGIGIPTWLPPGTTAEVAVAQAGAQAATAPDLAADRDWLVQTAALPEQDHCASLRTRWGSAPATAAPPAPQQKP